MRTSQRALLVMILILFGLATGGNAGHAQSPERERAFVYATTVFDGLTYASAMAPPDVETLYMIADRQNIIAPRRTMIYYWPITNRFLADWSLLNEVVEGELEVFRGADLVLSVPLQDYVIQYDSANPLETLRIGVGEDALAMHEAFEALFAAYRESLFDYYEAEQAYRAELDEIIINNEPGTVDPEDLPVRPEPVGEFTIKSTDPNKAYPLSLPEGRYTILMRDGNGIVVPDSRRSLVVFAQLQNGVAYSVVPQSRWTQPEDSVYPDAVIYAEPGATVYLQPSRESLFNELHYTRMLDPQDQASREDRTRWVLHDPYPNTTLRVSGADGSVQEAELKGYFVQQLAGSGLGYEVLEFNPETMQRSSFEGFALELSGNNPVYRVELLDEDGRPILGSRREIRVLNIDRGPHVYALALLPLAIGAVVYLARRRQIASVDTRAGG
ncbi:MAG TPA: hypothetical protein VMN57_00555 [Anaerolineales bacterium]|nr:hypothetical protein [Anaerolineales bacterium]